MTNPKEQQLQAFARRAVRASKALWPTNARRAIATSRAAQTRRQLIVKSHLGGWSALFLMKFKGRGCWQAKTGCPQGASLHMGKLPIPATPLASSQHGAGEGGREICSDAPCGRQVGSYIVSIMALAGVSTGMLVIMRLWLLFLFIAGLVAIFLFLVLARKREASVKMPASTPMPGAERRSFPGILGRGHSPNTPMPLEPPLVRVLETFDLSQSNVEHFLDLPDAGNTGGYSLESWKEAQMK